MAVEPVSDAETGLIPAHIEATLPAVPEENLAPCQPPVTSFQTLLDEDDLQPDTQLLAGSADISDAGMDLDLSGLSLEDADDVDGGVWSMPGSGEQLSLQSGVPVGVTEMPQRASNKTPDSVEYGLGSLEGEMHHLVLDELERFSVASSQPAGRTVEVSETATALAGLGAQRPDNAHDRQHRSESTAAVKASEIALSSSQASQNQVVQSDAGDHPSYALALIQLTAYIM